MLNFPPHQTIFNPKYILIIFFEKNQMLKYTFDYKYLVALIELQVQHQIIYKMSQEKLILLRKCLMKCKQKNCM